MSTAFGCGLKIDFKNVQKFLKTIKHFYIYILYIWIRYEIFISTTFISYFNSVRLC